jgi:hypothetical protein
MDNVEPPFPGQPPGFTGAVGSFHVTMRAMPTTLQAEDALVLTVRIAGTGSLKRIGRPDLKKERSFARHFHIDNLDDRVLPGEHAREFDYRLRPRSADVKEIPPLPFVIFLPGYLPEYKGYQTRMAPAIPLTVTPRESVEASQVQGGPTMLESRADLYELIRGPSVLRHDGVVRLPALPALLALAIGGPLCCLACYSWWRFRHPDAVALMRQRRTRAAREALRAARALSANEPSQQATRAAMIVTAYLRERLELEAAEPTPEEAASQVRRAGLSEGLSEQTAAFYRSCVAARFAPGLLPGEQEWAAAVEKLVLALEVEPCSLPSS